MLRFLLPSLLAVACLPLAPVANANVNCGGVESSGAFADVCSNDYAFSSCTTSYCYSGDGTSRVAGAGYYGNGGSASAAAGEASGWSCYSTSTFNDCYRSTSVGTGAGFQTFVPFVGNTGQYAYAGVYQFRDENSNGRSCGLQLYSSTATVPLTNDCTVTMPPLP